MPDATEPPFLVERVDPSTFESVLPLIADYQRFYGQDPDESRNRKFFGELLEDNPHGLQIAARRGPQVIGFATLYWLRVSTEATSVALLNDLFVLPGHRGGRETGVGTALLRAAARAARDRGFTSLTWETAPDNRSARALYDRFLAGAADAGGSSTWVHYTYPLRAEGEQ